MGRLLTLLVASTMTVMTSAAIAPTLPAMSVHFAAAGKSELWVKLVLTMPALMTAIGAPFAGFVIDHFGRRRLLVASTIAYGLAGSAGSVLGLTGILISRAALGLAMAGIMTTTTTLIVDYYEGAARNRVMGLQSASWGLGGVVYLTVGGLLADVQWRAPFLIYLLPLTFLFFILMFIREPESSYRKTVWAKRYGSDPLPVGLTVLLYVVAFSTMVVFYMIPVQIPFYLRSLSDISNTQIGLSLASFTLIGAMTSMQYGRLKERTSYSGAFFIVYFVMGLGYILLAAAGSAIGVAVGLWVTALGMGFFMPNLVVWANAGIPFAWRGRVVGGLTTCLALGQFFSVLITQPISDRVGLGHAYGIFGMMLCVSALAFLAAALMRRKEITSI